MLELIFGRPRSGKTHKIISEIKKSAESMKSTYLIVPDQQVFVSECMLADIGSQAHRYVKVIGFSRLGDLVFSKHGGLTRKNVSDGVKHLLIFDSLKELDGTLEHIKGNLNDTAYADMMLTAIDELSAMGISPYELEEAIANSDDESFVSKMKDISAVYASYLLTVKERLSSDIIMKCDSEKMLYEKIEKHSFFKGADVYVDSFTDFTGIEFNIIKSIIKTADKTVISLPISHRGDNSVYLLSAKETLRKLTKFARDNYIEIKDTICNFKNDSMSELSLLEKELWNFKLSSGYSIEGDNSVIMASCKNIYEEAEYVALKIKEFILSGSSYSDIAIIYRDAESKKGVINSVFDKYNIPYFYSEKTDLSCSSLSRLITSSLRCVNYNYKLDDILTMTKTGLCPISSYECDTLEDYCTRWSIHGSQFKEQVWNMNPDGYVTYISERGKSILECANKVKDIIIPPLMKLEAKLKGANDTPSMCKAIFSYLDEIKIRDSLNELCKLELSLGNTREAAEILRMYDYVISAISDISSIFKDKKLSIADLISSIEILLSHTDIGSVPAYSDYVTVGSASTLRIENAKIVFVCGLTEGEFPQNVSNNGILKEKDKEALSALGIDMPSLSEKLSSDELYFAHRAISKPQEKLILTKYDYDLSDGNRSPSIIWNRVLFILPHLKEKIEHFDASRLKLIINTENCDIESGDMLSLFGNEEESSTLNEQIDPLLARAIFGDKIKLSKSAISKFLECPYKYWCENVLNLRENKMSGMNSADIGTYVHFLLEKIINKQKSNSGELIYLTPDEVFKEANKISEDYISSIGFIPSPSMLYEISRYRNIACAMLNEIFNEFKTSSFKIASTEQHISESGYNTLKPMEIKVNVEENFTPKVMLMGNVDRIDTYENKNGIYVRIVDYKTSSNDFKLDKISEGHELQLPIYLFTVASAENKNAQIFKNKENKQIFPASAVFLSANEDNMIIKAKRSGFILSDDDVMKAASSELDPKILGVKKEKGEFSENCVSYEKMDEIKDTLITKVKDVAYDMYNGKARRTPSSDACQYCKIRASCHVAAKEKKF